VPSASRSRVAQSGPLATGRSASRGGLTITLGDDILLPVSSNFRSTAQRRADTGGTAAMAASVLWLVLAGVLALAALAFAAAAVAAAAIALFAILSVACLGPAWSAARAPGSRWAIASALFGALLAGGTASSLAARAVDDGSGPAGQAIAVAALAAAAFTTLAWRLALGRTLPPRH